MFNIIPLILILISLSIIIIIISRKFSVLANVDVENIPKEKEAKFKERIISGRLKRNITMKFSKAFRFIKPALISIANFFKWLYGKLLEIKDSYKSEEAPKEEKQEDKIDNLAEEANSLIKEEKLDEAEKKLIQVINLDNKNIEAFIILGRLYFRRKNYEEAKQTLEHVLKLEQGDGAEVYFDLALVGKETENFEEAVLNLRKALEIEPNNPRYLDTMLDIGIINKDKDLAAEAYKKLKSANPDNQKLEELKKQIDELS